MTTQTVTTIPTPRTTVEELDDTVLCCFDAEPVTDMREHALHCGDCFAYHVQEN